MTYFSGYEHLAQWKATSSIIYGLYAGMKMQCPETLHKMNIDRHGQTCSVNGTATLHSKEGISYLFTTIAYT